MANRPSFKKRSLTYEEGHASQTTTQRGKRPKSDSGAATEKDPRRRPQWKATEEDFSSRPQQRKR
ncbi:hypothetical protein P4O66_011342, partial [Electrophorus voltai]